MPTISELEVRETYIERLLAGIDELVALQLHLKSDKATVVDTLIEKVLTLIDSATDLQHISINTAVLLQELKSMCNEVTTVCNILAPTLTPKTSTVPVLTDCTINALPPSVPDPFSLLSWHL